jgi:plasmid stability protein
VTVANVLIRGIPDDAVATLKERAARNQRSLQQELRLLIEESAAETARLERRARARAEIERLREVLAASGKDFDSTEVIRWDRDNNYWNDSEYRPPPGR